VVRDPDEGRREVARLLESAGNPASSIERILPSLEDVFIHHVEAAEEARHSGREPGTTPPGGPAAGAPR
jgi:hypothetical protein